jgi:hypothetical protein
MELAASLYSYSVSRALSLSLSLSHALAMRHTVFALALVGVFCTHEGNLGVSGFSTFATNSLPLEVPSAFYTDSMSSQESTDGTGIASSMGPGRPAVGRSVAFEAFAFSRCIAARAAV